MKSLKLLLVFGWFGLLYKTVDANQIVEREEKVSFSVEKLWRSYQKNCCSYTCPVEDAPWLKGVGGHYDGCKGAIDNFCGTAKELGDVAIYSFRKYLAKLIYFTASNSTMVTTCSTAILNSLTKCIHLNRNGLNIIIEFNKVYLSIIDDFVKVAESVSVHIGDLTCTFTEAVRDVGSELSKSMNEFLKNCRLSGCGKKIDFDCVLEKLHKLMNVVSFINETLQKKYSKATKEVHESLMVLDLLYLYLAISVQGIYSCFLDALNSRYIFLSERVKASMSLFDDALVKVTQAICAVTLPLENSIIELLTDFDATLKSTVGEINKILSKDVTPTITQEQSTKTNKH